MESEIESLPNISYVPETRRVSRLCEQIVIKPKGLRQEMMLPLQGETFDIIVPKDCGTTEFTIRCTQSKSFRVKGKYGVSPVLFRN